MWGGGKTVSIKEISSNSASLLILSIFSHEYKEGTANQTSYFIELWDIGGSIQHKNARGVFYQAINGIILCHDLTNSKSQESLKNWLVEILNKEGKDTYKGNDYEIDPEVFLGSCQVSINLILGSKLSTSLL